MRDGLDQRAGPAHPAGRVALLSGGCCHRQKARVLLACSEALGCFQRSYIHITNELLKSFMCM